MFLVKPTDFTDKVAERLVDVDALLRRRLDEFATKMLGQIAALIHADLTLVFQVALVGHNDHWECVLVLHTQDLLVVRAYLLEGVPGSDRVHEKEALARAHVLFPHGSVLFLTGRVEDVQKSDLFINNALLPIRVFNRRVILVYEVLLDELDRQGRFADATAADNDKLVLSEKLRLRSGGHLCKCSYESRLKAIFTGDQDTLETQIDREAEE